MLPKKKKILVYGYGNPGRQDDGLGIRLAQDLEQFAHSEGLTHIHFETNYQLNIEDAEIISNYDLVFFADASYENLEKGIAVSKLNGADGLTFTTHAASPAYVLHLCSTLFSKVPESYLIHIKGYEWEFREGLSPKAYNNLSKAILFMQKVLNRTKHMESKVIQNSELKIHN